MFYDIEISDDVFFEPLSLPILRRQRGCKNLLKLTNFEDEVNLDHIIYRSGPDFIHNEEYNEENIKKEHNEENIKKEHNENNENLPKITKINSEDHTKKVKLESPTIKRFYTY